MSYRDEILNLPQFYATTAVTQRVCTSTISASERHVLMARFMAVSQALALNIAASADAEIAELRRDAERYRKLRSMHWSNDDDLTVTRGRSVKLGFLTYSGDQLDAAIDAARGGE